MKSISNGNRYEAEQMIERPWGSLSNGPYRVVKFLICIFIMRLTRLSINRKEQILVGGLLLVSIACSISAWKLYSNGMTRNNREIRSTDVEEKVVPDFLIIGAQFCGTEYLQKILRHHPKLKQCRNGISLHNKV